jgi:hypothetical protein
MAYYNANKAFLEQAGPIRVLRDISIVTVSNYPEETLFEKSAKAWGYPLAVVGKRVKHFGMWHKWYCLREEALAQIKTEYVLFCDSKDVLITRPLDGLVGEMQAAYPGTRMLFNADAFIWPHKTPAELLRFEEQLYGSLSPWHYLNSGVSLTRTDFLREVIDEIIDAKCVKDPANSWYRRWRYRLKGVDIDYRDQEACHHLHQRHYPQVSIDHQCMLFQVTSRLKSDGTFIGE